MWPQGSNCSFLTGLHDYFEDIKNNQSSSLLGGDINEIEKICSSLSKLILNQRHNSKNLLSSISKSIPDEKQNNIVLNSVNEERLKKFFDFAKLYMNDNPNWDQLKELYNFSHPHDAIPDNIDPKTYHSQFLCKFCKEKGNEHMKNKKINSAIEMYTQAIQLMEKEIKKYDNNGNITAGGPGVSVSDNNDNPVLINLNKLKCEIAIIFCNRSAAYVYLRDFQKAVDDAVMALKYDPLLTKAWIRKGMAEQELQRFQIAYGDYQVALNQSQESDNYYNFLIKKIKQCFDKILQNTQNNGSPVSQRIDPNSTKSN